MTDGPDRQAAEWQYVARSLRKLVTANDGKLEVFRSSRMGDDSVQLEKLCQARDLLDAVARWVQSPNHDHWRVLASAHAALADAPAPTQQVNSDPGAETASLNISSAQELRAKLALPFSGDATTPDSISDEYSPKDTGTVHLSDDAAALLRNKMGASNKK